MDRPAGVSVLAILLFIWASSLGWAGLSMAGSLGMRFGVIGGAACVLFAVFMIALGVGLWRLRCWARVFTVVLACLHAALHGLSILNAAVRLHPLRALWPLILLGMDVAIIYYLLLPHVKRAFDPPLPVSAIFRNFSCARVSYPHGESGRS